MAAFKAQSMARDIKQRLQLKVAGIKISEFSDSSFFPILLIEKGSGGSREALYVKIEMLPDAASHKDGLDQPQRNYSPHIVKILREDAGGAEAIQQPDLREQVSADCAGLGCKMQIWEKEGIRLATDASLYNLAGASQVSEMSADPMKANPLTNSQ